jgi:hypothetical protein
MTAPSDAVTLTGAPALATAQREALPPGRELRIVAAELGSEAGLVGAGLVAFEALDGIR